jgi:RNA polymerase sigma-70 factor (ECF subfamily)
MSGTATIDDVDDALESHRRELTGYCYRMLGSGSEAEDAVQETMVRAWRAMDSFEGRSSLRSWLYRISTNVCLDMMQSPQRRARPTDLGPASQSDSHLDAGLAEHAWVMPIQDSRVLPDAGDPGEVAAGRESVRLAFVATLQHLPPRQRAVLILRDVLRWQATEVAELLDTSVASVNSALQRARATLEGARTDSLWPTTLDQDDAHLVARYVDAFERYDVTTLVTLLHQDAIQSMPPFALWLRGRDQIGQWFVGQGAGCEGARLVPTRVNGCPAFGSYRVDPAGGHMPFSIQLLEIQNGEICGYHHFLYPELFAAFGLPDHLDD